MDWYQLQMEKLRIFRSKKLSGLGKVFLKIRITANIMTSLSLIFGILSVYFLFESYWLFLIFAILHVLADATDGVIARVQGPTKFGNYFDALVDSFITFLALLKIGIYLNDYYAFLVVGLYLLSQVVYFLNDRDTPILFTRTLTLILLMFYLPSVSSYANYILILTYLCTGVASVYSLAKQLQWFIGKRKERTS
ncbi:MAG: CDP-alcohol phosphatidyltransferase family protein [Candidatus Woesearchaeota archaeon]|jgi:phosphatidylglycerophosphate synthase